MSDVFDLLPQQSLTQWLALVTGLVYVLLAAYEKPLCWLFGIVSCMLIAFDDFLHFQLYADGVLEIAYILFGFAGLYYWLSGTGSGTTRPTVTWEWERHAMPLLGGALISIPIAIVLRTYTNAAFTFLDTLTTVFSLWATWLLVRKVLENWLYWIVIDLIYVALFWQRGGKLIAVLYTAYMLIATWGYLQWRRGIRQNADV